MVERSALKIEGVATHSSKIKWDISIRRARSRGDKVPADFCFSNERDAERGRGKLQKKTGIGSFLNAFDRMLNIR